MKQHGRSESKKDYKWRIGECEMFYICTLTTVPEIVVYIGYTVKRSINKNYYEFFKYFQSST